MFPRCLFVCVIAAVWLCACKDPILEDTPLTPDSRLAVTVTDTLTLITQTVREKPLRTDEMSTHIVGTTNDPVFGRSVAGTYFQLRLTTNNISLGTDAILDSAVLMLRYAGSYGDITRPLSFLLYQLNESMDKEAAYYSDKTFALQREIGRISHHLPDLTRELETLEGKLPPHLRIRLHQTVAQELFDEAKNGSSQVANNENFLQFFKGVFLVADENAGGNAMLYFDLYAAPSSLTFYYHTPSNDSLTWKIIVDNASATSNFYKHDYRGSMVERFLGAKRASSDSIVFIQSMAGLKVKVMVPYLKNLGNIAINKAELIITGIKTPLDITSEFAPPARLTLNAADSLGNNDFVDDQFISENYFGGTRSEETLDLGKTVNRYKFNTALYYQHVINGTKPDYGLFILTFPSPRIADRLVAGGGNHSTHRMKLKLTYTKLD